MFRWLCEWLKTDERLAEVEAFERGFGYAAVEILLYEREPHTFYNVAFDRNHFDRGMNAAINAIEELRKGDSNV